MCGIAGILGPDIAELPSVLTAMAKSLRHRGPDDEGIWTDVAAGIGLAHRRLSILDLSPQGKQPMISASGRWLMVYNGELYNYRALRQELDAVHTLSWRGHSDTEVLLAAIDCWGLRKTLERSNGMFAFAVWDRVERRLILARDRMGEKPLYVGWVGSALAFASELKALRQIPGWQGGVDRKALALLLRYGYVPAPWSIHPYVFKLPAGSWVSFTLKDAQKPHVLEDFAARCERYWDLAEVATRGQADTLSSNLDEAVETLKDLLTDAVRLRMEADVPVGAILSGGIDSSLVVALMQKVASQPVRTFTIGFHEARFNETTHAKQVAAHLGTEHTECYLTPRDALAVIPRLPEIYDEPFADASQIPAALVAQIARRRVSVALSGDGGDELFCGYQRYLDALRIWRWVGWWPARLRWAAAHVLVGCGEGFGRCLGFRTARLGRRLQARDFDVFCANLAAFSLLPLVVDGLAAEAECPPVPVALEEPMARMRFIDQMRYLPDDILTKVDRASMAVSLELRVPLLDPRVVAFSWRLPEKWLSDGRIGKVLLRQLLYRHVPQCLVDRPKRGFDVPLDDWLRGPLRDWMGDLLLPTRLQGEGYVDANVVGRLVREHLSGRGNHGYALWGMLMFEAWRQAQR